MKIEHLSDRVKDYKASIEKVVDKKIMWKNETKNLLIKTLNAIAKKFAIGWRVQELNWIGSNEAVNITFDSFPPDLIEKTNLIPSYQFIQGCALIFSQSYNGEVHVIILFPLVDNIQLEDSTINLGIFDPQEINEKLITEKVDEFLKEMIKWEVPIENKKLGFMSEK
jgi:hypothetical protein